MIYYQGYDSTAKPMVMPVHFFCGKIHQSLLYPVSKFYWQEDLMFQEPFPLLPIPANHLPILPERDKECGLQRHYHGTDMHTMFHLVYQLILPGPRRDPATLIFLPMDR